MTVEKCNHLIECFFFFFAVLQQRYGDVSPFAKRIPWNWYSGDAKGIPSKWIFVRIRQYHSDWYFVHIWPSYFSELLPFSENVPIAFSKFQPNLHTFINVIFPIAFQVRSQYILCKRRRVPILTYPISMKLALEEGPPYLRWLAPFAV